MPTYKKHSLPVIIFITVAAVIAALYIGGDSLLVAGIAGAAIWYFAGKQDQQAQANYDAFLQRERDRAEMKKQRGY